MTVQKLNVIVQLLNIMKKNNTSPEKNEDINADKLNILREIEKSPNISQRDLALELGVSLGKVNYCLKALQKKGLIKFNNFRKSKNKIKYLYFITPQGMTLKTKLTINFMKRKMKEYDELKKELENIK